ncbi:MAG: dipeptidyl aminopeptidase/acylaminoacyl peptidase [Rhodothermales bacterium]|jgi:dipeptidyl aminopeptidase/acylaminoacyl peptidase
MSRHLTLALVALLSAASVTAQTRPMTFMDAQEMRRAGSWEPSPDGQWMLYTLTTPDWKTDKPQTDIHLVSTSEGIPSDRRLTYTQDADETSPTWTPDGSAFLFVSSREEDGGDRQLFRMNPNGGEAQKFSEAEGGVSDFEFSPDGSLLVFRAGESGQQQLFSLSADELVDADPFQLTDGEAGVDQWDWAPDSGSIYFTRDDSFDESDKERKKKGFTVDVKNQETPLTNLWRVTVASALSSQLTNNPDMSVDGFTISDDGRWIGIRGGSVARYERNITVSSLYSDLFLMDAETGGIERLTDNYEVSESGPIFSPDGRLVAFSAADDLTRYTMTERKLYVRDVEEAGGAFRKLGADFDNSIGGGFFSDDGNTYYFGAGVRATRQVHALDLRSGAVQQLTNLPASLSISRDEDSGLLLASYSDAKTQTAEYAVESMDHADDPSSWVQLVEPNPQIATFDVPRMEEIEWTASDGNLVGGVLTYPIGYREGQRYPLVVDIHGGPASADVVRFDNNATVYAGAGYVHFQPNYRGSTGYGNAHRTDIVGDYFTLGFEDIMTGVDHLIDEGIVDGNRMGAFGWSAGGHWSNWILTHTDRFKAISSGAGTMNWISMYAQSDVQRNRQFYIGDDFLYENFEPYWDQSPLKYIANAKTPTMVHVVAGDPRVPSPQSVELHMALKKLGVPTELFMYPGQSHGIPDARNRLVKSVSEMAWMDYYVRGVGEKFDWEMVLKTLEAPEEEKEVEADPVSEGDLK